MKSWFPFTDYDFYACVISGALLIGVVDYVFFASTLATRANWSTVQSIVWIGVAYVVGQISAAPSSAIVEQLVATKWLRSPAAILLGFTEARWREILVRVVFAHHEYRPLPSAVQTKIKSAARSRLGCEPFELSAEGIFQVAFPVARSVPDSAARLDRFIALYGFARNLAFAALVSALLLLYSLIVHYRSSSGWLFAAALIVAGGMFGRYMKFYAAYASEVFRTFNKVVADHSGE